MNIRNVRASFRKKTPVLFRDGNSDDSFESGIGEARQREEPSCKSPDVKREVSDTLASLGNMTQITGLRHLVSAVYRNTYTLQLSRSQATDEHNSSGTASAT
ncbi:hypothetical protein F2P81_023191 [Scophthalmus maximus]|uniref:Uncharacterized protein n=1 Tax=Scophthalmus maximus TaxID=52904 RepID=A0A6A4RVS1_SCOMX|nr:hypothetical protein F2P81_023191 [Scophthalmus maximus]